MKAHVYLLTCLTSGKSYVGISKCSAEKRFKDHCKNARKGSKLFLHKAIRKYGAETFVLKILAVVETWEQAKNLEREFIASRDTFAPTGYNMTRGGEGTIDYKHTDAAKAVMSQKHAGKVLSDETRQRMSAASKGKPKAPEHANNIRAALLRQLPYSPERIAKAAAALPKGPLSDEHRKKIGDALRGRKQDPAVVAARIPLVRAGMTLSARQKIIASNKRRVIGAATRQKMSQSLQVALARPEVKEKMAASNAARVWKAESRAKLSAAHRGRIVSAETKEKMRLAAAAAWAARRQVKAERHVQADV